MTFALLLSATLAASPAEQTLRTQCLVWAADPKNPWALAHGLHCLGPSFVARDGRKASEVIVHDFLLRNQLPDGGVGPGAPLGFLRYGADKTPIEPHSNLNAKSLIADAKLPLSTKFKTSWGGTVTLQQLLDSVKLGFRHVPQSQQYWMDVGWTLTLFAQTQKPGAKWTTSDGSKIDLDQVFDDALTELERETADLEAGLQQHLPEVPKRKQGVYAHSCGGLHFVQGVLAWARHPAVRKKWGPRVDRQIAILFYRLGSERSQYDAAYQVTLSSQPQYKLQVLVQMVKFYGHWLETVAMLRDELKWKPDATQQIAINRAEAYLDFAVRGLNEAKAFESMPQLAQSQPQVYLDLIGDSCHAAHGLEAWHAK